MTQIILDPWERLKDLATIDKARRFVVKNESFVVATNEIKLDFNAQYIDVNILRILFELAESCQLRNKITAMMCGAHVNHSENKPALHTALRIFEPRAPLLVNGQNIIPDIFDARLQMASITDRIRSGEWLGFSNKAITDIVNIGIGGSQLGPQFCVTALAEFVTDKLNFHFISEFDPLDFEQVVAKLNPETTLFIISSKSFATKETLYNAQKALLWVNQPEATDRHFIAVTAETEKAKLLGFNNILPIWSFVGGRYSFCSAINLITCIAIGYENFISMLRGAHEMDNHFNDARFEENLPILLALIGIWNINFLEINNLLILTYARNLHSFVSHVQQLDMESNGKSKDLQLCDVSYATGPIIFGGSGNQAQHSYFQLLCQGTHHVAADLIDVFTTSHSVMNKMCVAHKTVLSRGFHHEIDENSSVRGKTPVNHITLSSLTPKSIGALIALYEHKVFVQSVIWNINPFDQPGVESSKRLLG